MDAFTFFQQLFSNIIQQRGQPLPRCYMDRLATNISTTFSRPYRVLHIIPNLETGGTEWNLYRICTNLNPHEFQQHVMTIGNPGALYPQFQDAGVYVVSLNIHPPLPHWHNLRSLLHELRTFQPDVVVGWLYHGNFLAFIISLWCQCSLIWNIRQCLPQGYQDKRGTRFLLRLNAWISRFPQAIVYNSTTSARQHEQLGYCSHHTQIVPNSTDSHVFFPDPTAYTRMRDWLKLTPQTRLVGMIARYHPVKGHELFFQAAAIALATFPDLHFVLVGKDVTFANPALQKLAKDYAIPEQQLHLLGEQPLPIVAQITQALDIATSCSLAEAQSNVILEALACQVPCIVTDVGESASLVQNPAWVVPVGNPHAMAQAWIQELIRKNMSKKIVW